MGKAILPNAPAKIHVDRGQLGELSVAVLPQLGEDLVAAEDRPVPQAQEPEILGDKGDHLHPVLLVCPVSPVEVGLVPGVSHRDVPRLPFHGDV